MLTPRNVEAWALRILDHLASGKFQEDSLVELKSEWPADDAKTARRIAGHANASRDSEILWIIGADEKRGVLGVDNPKELANWWPRVKSHFDHQAPALVEIQVESQGKLCMALGFDTSLAPYVVTNPAGGQVSHEVPWRENTSIRSARRSDLILLLSDRSNLPDVEVLETTLNYAGFKRNDQGEEEKFWELAIETYFMPGGGDIVLPRHRMEGIITADDGSFSGEVISVRFLCSSQPDGPLDGLTFRKDFHQEISTFAAHSSRFFDQSTKEVTIRSACAISVRAKFMCPAHIREKRIGLSGRLKFAVGIDRLPLTIPFAVQWTMVDEANAESEQ